MSSRDESPPRFKLALLALAPTLLLFGAIEVALRIAGFQYSETPLEVRRFTDDPQGVVDREIAWRNRDGVERFVKDAHQLWVPKTSPLARHELVAAPGTFRIATLGDSCTAYCVSTRETFPELAERFLNARGGRAVEVLNAGVASYSSHQGLKRLRHAVLPYQPDLVTVYFGWNDHWITGTPDHEIAQAGRALLARLRSGRDATGDGSNSQPIPRVDLEHYDENLREIVAVARAAGSEVLLVTAPQDLRNWNNDDLQPIETEALVALHARYNDVVRAVAAETGAGLLDLDALVEHQKPKRLIAKDGIHLNPVGCRFTARAVSLKIAKDYLRD
jgi:lysophospholipase L1-like esterase